MNTNPTYYKRYVKDPNTGIYFFNNTDDIQQFVLDESKNLRNGTNLKKYFDAINSKSYSIDEITSRGIYWFGTMDANSVIDTKSTYLFNNTLNNFISKITNKVKNISIKGIDQNKKLMFTEQEVGIFSYDLASLGLIKEYVFYSPLLKEIVSANLVVSEKNSNGQLIFFHIYVPEVKEHPVIPDFRGFYSPVLHRIVPKDKLMERDVDGDIVFYYPYQPEIQRHEVERRQKIVNGKPKFSSTFKKSFVHIKKNPKPIPRIDIIVSADVSSGINAVTEIPFSSAGAIAIAEELSRLNINYRILGLFATRGSIDYSKKTFAFFLLKKEGEPLDKNKISIALSDARFLRYENFKETIISFFDMGFTQALSSGLGSPILNKYEIKNNYLWMLEQSMDPEDKESARYPDTKFVFSGSYSEQDAYNEYEEVIKKLQQ